MQSDKIDMDQAHRTLVIIWAAVLMSQVLLLGLLYLIKSEVFEVDFAKPVLGDNKIVVLVLGAFAIHIFMFSFISSRRYFNQAITERDPSLVQMAMIVGCALCEAISFFGFFLAFAFDYEYFFLWFMLGIFGTILHFPRRSNVIAANFKN